MLTSIRPQIINAIRLNPNRLITTMMIENYDEKDRSEGKTEIKVRYYKETPTGYEATFAYKLYNNKDKLMTEGEYGFECDNGLIKMDMSGFVPAESLEAFKSMEVEVTMDQLEYPSDMQVGQTLKNGTFEVKTKNSPMPMNMVFEMNDRKVEARETVTTPAGTFDCFKISYNTNSKIMIANTSFKSVQYLAEKYGAVKTETYKSNGKLIGYSLLSKYEY